MRDFFERWLDGRAMKDMRKMNKMFFSEGGVFDSFAGKDGIMNREEMKAMNNAVREGMGKEVGQEIPAYSDEQFDAIYKAYKNLNASGKATDGFDKWDAIVAQGIFNQIRSHRITDEEVDQYWDLGEWFHDIMSDLPDSKYKNEFFDWIHSDKHVPREEIEKYWIHYDADKDGRLNRPEFIKSVRDNDKMMMDLNKDMEPFSRGEEQYLWTTYSNIQNGPWNRWGHHGHGESVDDQVRLMRILRRVMREIESDDGDDELFLL